MPTLVIVGGNESEGWEGAMMTQRKDGGIAERRRKAREEKTGDGVGERKGHEYKKSEKVIVERM